MALVRRRGVADCISPLFLAQCRPARRVFLKVPAGCVKLARFLNLGLSGFPYLHAVMAPVLPNAGFP